jgi:hypothetical protein
VSTIAIVCYCPRCSYFVKVATRPDAIGTHGCVQCNRLMEVYIARGGQEVVRWHNALTDPAHSDADKPAPQRTRAGVILADMRTYAAKGIPGYPTGL